MITIKYFKEITFVYAILISLFHFGINIWGGISDLWFNSAHFALLGSLGFLTYEANKNETKENLTVTKKEKPIAKEMVEKKVDTANAFTKDDFQKYQKAVGSFQIRDYENAYKLFNKLSLIYSNNEQLNYYLGRSSFELKKYSQSYAAFNKIDIKNELHLRIRLEKARTLYFLKSYDLALGELNKILQYPISIKVRSNIEKFIKTIQQEKM